MCAAGAHIFLCLGKTYFMFSQRLRGEDMNLNKTYRRAAALVLGVLLFLPGAGLAYLPGLADEIQAVNNRSVLIRPLYLDQLQRLEANKAGNQAPPLTHTVSKGETLSLIGKRYGLAVQELVKLNNLRNANFIREGQVLVLAAAEPAAWTAQAAVVHTLRRGETVWDLSRAYRVGTDNILAANGIADPTRLLPGQKLVIPGPVVASRSTAPEREATAVSRSAPRVVPDFIWPVTGRITSGFGPRWGRFHCGIDIAAGYGSPIVAAAAGTVTESGWRGTYGYMLRIDHHNGWESLYAHASKLHVKNGAKVAGGQVIASIGQTGNATGPHLHLELIYQGQHQNPVRCLP
jgi:murein DD-endopeptidase MepM/ murein hydrolase activator NlpD